MTIDVIVAVPDFSGDTRGDVMTISLVTGGSGFIGHHLVDQLIDSGERVRVLDLEPPPMRHEKIEFVQGSVPYDPREDLNLSEPPTSGAPGWQIAREMFDPEPALRNP